VLRSLSNRVVREVRKNSRLGIHIGRMGVSAAKLSYRSNQYRLDWVASHRFDQKLFGSGPDAAQNEMLCASIRKLCKPAIQEHLSINVALPDPLGAIAVFRLDDMPSDINARLNLARLRFSKELFFESDNIRCSAQSLGEENGGFLLYSSAIPSSWCSFIEQAFHKEGFLISSMDYHSSFRFNQLHDLFDCERRGGALVDVSGEAWSIILRDSKCRPRYVRSRWIDTAPGREGEQLTNRIGTELERAVRAFHRFAPTENIGSLRVCADGELVDMLVDELNSRIQGNCEVTRPIHGISDPDNLAQNWSVMESAAVVAAIGR